MSVYYRAFPVDQLSRFATWHRHAPSDGPDAGDVCYVRDDLRITDDPLGGDAITVEPADEWKRFCVEELGFAVPTRLWEDA